jgi:peptidyl-prolyl cis-trans isomerase C
MEITMKFKIGCAAFVLTFLCYDTCQGGALKKAFTKKDQINDKKAEEAVSSHKEVAESTVAPTSQEDTKAPTKSVQEQPAVTTSSESSQTEKKKIVGDPVVLRIGGKKEFRRSQILEDIKMIPPQMIQGISPDKLFEMLVTQRLNAYLMIEQAKRANMDRTKDFLDKVEHFKEELLGRTFLIKELAPKAENEPALKARYTRYLVEFKKGKECKVLHIMLSSEDAAKEVLSLLAKGEDFEKLAKEKSEAQSKANGGDEGYVPLEVLPPEIKDKIAVLKNGEYTKEFVKTENGFHVFKITDTRDTVPQKFEEAKNMLKQVIMHEEMLKLIERLEKQTKVERFNEDGTPFVLQPEKAAPVGS